MGGGQEVAAQDIHKVGGGQKVAAQDIQSSISYTQQDIRKCTAPSLRLAASTHLGGVAELPHHCLTTAGTRCRAVDELVNIAPVGDQH